MNLAIRDYPSATLRDGRGGADLNGVVLQPAVRFYCEYRTRERIHRGIADPRLLAIPTS